MANMSAKIYSILLLLMSFNTTISDGVISLDFFAVTQNEYLVVPIGIGTPEQKLNLVLDIGAQRSWISEKIFQKASSSSLKTETDLEAYEHDHYSYIGLPANDVLRLSETTFDSYNFLLVEQYRGTPPFDGVLSIGNKYDKKKYSIAYLLSAKSTIYCNTFTLKFSDMNKGVINIGDMTNEMKDYDHLIDSCANDNMDPPSIKWKCKLTHAFIGDNTGNSYQDSRSRKVIYKINEKESKVLTIGSLAYFETVYNKIYAPSSFLEYLKANLFVDRNNKAICSFNKEKGVTRVQCSNEEIESIARLHFVFDSTLDLFLNKEQLFDCMEVCTFVVMNDEKIDHWVIGLPILRNYQVSFAYADPKISFYGYENKQLVSIHGDSTERGVIFAMLTLLMIVVLIGSLGIGFIYLIKKKNTKRMEIEEKLYTKNVSGL